MFNSPLLFQINGAAPGNIHPRIENSHHRNTIPPNRTSIHHCHSSGGATCESDKVRQ